MPGRVDGTPRPGSVGCVRFGDVEVRPLGGGAGCLVMLALSVLASVVLTVLLNVVLRLVS